MITELVPIFDTVPDDDIQALPTVAYGDAGLPQGTTGFEVRRGPYGDLFLLFHYNSRGGGVWNLGDIIRAAEEA